MIIIFLPGHTKGRQLSVLGWIPRWAGPHQPGLTPLPPARMPGWGGLGGAGGSPQHPSGTCLGTGQPDAGPGHQLTARQGYDKLETSTTTSLEQRLMALVGAEIGSWAGWGVPPGGAHQGWSGSSVSRQVWMYVTTSKEMGKKIIKWIPLGFLPLQS